MRYRKKRPLSRKTGQLRDTRLIVVATEGTKSEPAYLRGLHNSRVQIWILETESGRSSPDHVMERIDAFRNEHEFFEDDEFWLMIDVDRWGPRKLATIA